MQSLICCFKNKDGLHVKWFYHNDDDDNEDDAD